MSCVAMACCHSAGAVAGASRSFASVARRPAPSPQVKRLFAELLSLEPADLALLRKACRDRLTPLPSGHRGAPPKNYKPKELARKRDDQPLPVRGYLGRLAPRLSALHPAWIFAGSGPGIRPIPMSPLGLAIMGPHAAELMAQQGPSAPLAAPAVEPGSASGGGAEAVDADEATEEAAETQKPAEEALKPNVALKLVSFPAANKIKVIKEVRALLGEGMKETKDRVESAPCTLRKGVPRADAEKQAEKLRAVGAEVVLE